MRTLKISLLVFILQITISAQWFWQNPNPQPNEILNSYFIDEMNGWAVGYYGACIKTTDGGDTWENIQMPTDTYLSSVQFTDINKGFIGDWGGNLFETTDGGETWSIQHIDNYAHIRVFFVNQNYGWLLSWNKIYRTTNGGETWQSYTLSTMIDVFFIDTSKGFVIGGPGIMMSTDGGMSWINVNCPVTTGLYKITFKNNLEGFIVGDNGTLLKTIDGGLVWEYQTLGQNLLWDISFFGESSGVIVGNSSKIFITSNGGGTWLDRTFSSVWALRSCDYLNDNDCIVFGENGDIYKSTNRGSSFTSKVSGDRNTINDIVFISDVHGFTVGDSGTIMTTYNRGTNWEKLTPVTDKKLHSISFTDNLYGWIVGNSSVLLKTIDGGIGWELSTIPGSNDLRAVYFINNTIGWAGGSNNKIFKTTDSGDNWITQQINVGSTTALTSISMIDENLGYMCGIYVNFNPPLSIVLKTTNGGNTWDLIKQVNNTSFYSIFFTDDLNGWVTGYASTTIRTTDGGISWLSVPIGGGNDIFFTNLDRGIKVSNLALGSDITITTDGGDNWTQQPEITEQYLYAAYADQEGFWGAGSGGSILYSKNPIITELEESDDYTEQPSNIYLSQNYPNPFNPFTKIKYSIPQNARRETGNVSLKIYDVLGREIATLVNEEKPAGEYEVEFNAANLLPKGSLTSGISAGGGYASGVYFYQLKAGEYIETRKMILLK